MSIQASRGDTATLSIPPSAAHIAATLDFAEQMAAAAGFDDKGGRQIRLPLEELLEFLRHSALDLPDAEPLSITFETLADGLRLLVVEKGLPMDINNLPSYLPASESDLDIINADALGVFLGGEMVDGMIFTNCGRGGVEVEMLKHRPAAHVRNHMGGAPTVRPTTPSKDKLNYQIRPAAPGEYLEISHCAFLAYGYTYEDYIYYPEHIAAMN